MICLSRVWLQTELDDTRYCYQLIKTKKKFEEKNRHRFYVFIKYPQLIRRNARQQRALMTRSVYLHRHDVLTFLLIVLLHCPITSVARTLSYWCEIGLVITSHVYITCIYKPVFKKVTIWAPILFPLEKYGRISEEESSLKCKYNVCFVSPSTIAKKVFLLQCDKCKCPVHRLFDEKRKGICI